MSPQTLTLNTADLYLRSQKSPIQFQSPLPQIPSDFPISKLIPKTRFIIDGFRNAGDFSLSYFLSHFHSDHYTGLTSTWHHGIVFCSEITGNLVSDVLGVSSDFIVKLPVNVTVIIDDCEVTLIDANHCPGAVQFLFKVPVNGGKFEKFVHTGDFRFCDDMKLLPVLNDFIGCDSVFLDTTYCNPKFVFPLQNESIDYAVSVIERINGEDRDCRMSVLFLVATYVIGKEKILVEISRRCGCKVYVDSRKMKVLRALGYGDESVFTEDESATNVHVVGWNVLGETWPYFRPNFVKMKEIMIEKGYRRVVGFVPTGWTYEVKKNKFAVRTKDSFEIHLVPYSEHSNYNELREYVKFLKPKRVIPTVDSDVESMDSKHASKMQKHFAGLVDEMANKQEFLMGFLRMSKGKEGCEGGDSAIGAGKFVESDREIGIKPVLCTSGAVHLQNLAMLNENDKKEIIQELRDFLPVWVSDDQRSELLNIYGRNIVDAVSHFYEHETEFHQQSGTSFFEFHEKSGMSFSSCQPNSVVDSPAVESPSFDKCSHTEVKLPLKNLKFPHSKHPVVGSVSPGKRKINAEKNTKKKRKVTSNVETSGIKQSTITKFFSKSNPASLSEKFSSDNNSSDINSGKPYTEEVDQFIQIINGKSSERGYAAKLIKASKGNMDLALDMYYSNSKVDLPSHEVGKDAIIGSLAAEDLDPSHSSQGKDGLEASDRVHESAKESSEKNFMVNYITLPPEQYSPVEHACWKQGRPAPYLHLSRTFELVEGEKGKIKATAMLCNMFRSLLALSPEDVLPAVYLCTNKIAADHENVELNIGGSLISSAIEEACGTNRVKIREMYNTYGDLGDVAQECRQTQSLLLPPPPLLIRDVYLVLRKISVQTGSGSTNRRKSLILGLMRSCREKEMKFLVRTLARNLRIGATMRTILPALAQAVALNSLSSFAKGPVKNSKELLQGLSAVVVDAYNVLPDLGILVPSLMTRGIEFSATTLTMLPGIPIKPMLAKITNGVAKVLKLFQNRAFTCEYKYDGQRAQIHKLDDGSVRIFSRNGDETSKRFPDVVHIIQELCKLSAVSFILDTEVVGIDRMNGHKFLSFQELSTRERGSKVSLATVDKIKVDICVIVFDVMFVNGEKLLACPLRKRRQCMRELFQGEKPGFFEYAQEMTVEAEDARPDCEATVTKINTFLEDSFQSSCEGIMVKSLDVDAAYIASKRADTWLKVKRDYLDGLGDSFDLVPIGAWHGNGRKAGWYSPFLVACYNPDTEEFESVCRVMSGFSDSFYTEMKDFFSEDKILYKRPVYYRTDETPDMWFPAEIVWEIRGADLTVSPVHKAAVGIVHPSRGISMRFPRFVRSLSDRRPEDCSTSTDIADMFNSQTRKMDLTSSH
ncbi:DNA ligase 6 isoform X2 [Silene latifolia]|uniref:DNA ligase 6 isoform X2 n=1 Tax=Silene latifolia TaxID=37657 RepID=UPI003D77C50A